MNIYRALPRVFLGIPVYIATVYLSGTEELSPRLGTLSVKFLEFKVSSYLKCISQPGLRSFYKACSKKFGLNFCARILIQQYKNTPGYDIDLEKLNNHLSPSL